MPDKIEQFSEMVIHSVQFYCDKRIEKALKLHEQLEAMTYWRDAVEKIKELEERLAAAEDSVRALKSAAAPARLQLQDGLRVIS
jgi:exonuclease VII small subunit